MLRSRFIRVTSRVFQTTAMGLLALAAVGGLAGEASADYLYPQTITSSTGSFGTQTGTVGVGNTASTLGSPNGAFIQFGAGSSLTLDFATLLSGPAELRLFTYDDLYPATASVEVSADDSNYTTVASSVSDANGTKTGNAYPFVSIAVNAAFRYVRITDLGTSAAPYHNLGFDLDAVRAATIAVPELSSINLMAGAMLGVLGYGGWRRKSAVGPRLDGATD